MGFHWIFLISAGLLLQTPTALFAQADTVVVEPNTVCGPKIVSGGRFNMTQMGPQLEGSWSEIARGTNLTTGVQTSVLEVVYDRLDGRLYLQSEGRRIQLTPVLGARREMGWDYRNNRPIPPEQLVSQLSMRELGIVSDCETDFAPQFSWEVGTGARRSSGYLTFLSRNMAIGVKWNDAMGSREQVLSR